MPVLFPPHVYYGVAISAFVKIRQGTGTELHTLWKVVHWTRWSQNNISLVPVEQWIMQEISKWAIGDLCNGWHAASVS